jgi:hypothetical protein
MIDCVDVLMCWCAGVLMIVFMWWWLCVCVCWWLCFWTVDNCVSVLTCWCYNFTSRHDVHVHTSTPTPRRICHTLSQFVTNPKRNFEPPHTPLSADRFYGSSLTTQFYDRRPIWFGELQSNWYQEARLLGFREASPPKNVTSLTSTAFVCCLLMCSCVTVIPMCAYVWLCSETIVFVCWFWYVVSKLMC